MYPFRDAIEWRRMTVERSTHPSDFTGDGWPLVVLYPTLIKEGAPQRMHSLCAVLSPCCRSEWRLSRQNRIGPLKVRTRLQQPSGDSARCVFLRGVPAAWDYKTRSQALARKLAVIRGIVTDVEWAVVAPFLTRCSPRGWGGRRWPPHAVQRSTVTATIFPRSIIFSGYALSTILALSCSILTA
jgi:hypothetical protein